MNRITAIVALLLLAVTGRGAEWQQQWKKATDYYLQKQYDSAAHYYELVAATKPHNAEVYYNLGNTYYRLNRIAPAILNYERALHVDPGHRDAKDNLAITQARISHFIAPTPDIFFLSWWQSITAQTMTDTWTIAALLCFLAALGTWAARRYTARGSILPVQVPGIMGFLCIGSLVFGFTAASRVVASGRAVVFSNDTPLMGSQQQKGKPLALLPEGTTVRIINDAGPWLEVSLPNSRTGWVAASAITRI